MPDEKNMELSEKGLLSRDNAADDEDKIVPAAASFRQEASAADGNCGGHRWLKNKKRGTVPDDAAAPSSSSSNKKRRCVWTDDLHKKFVAAFNQLGSTDAVPQKILGVMNVPGLTRDHVGSHLQKYRDRLRKELRRLQEESSSPISQPPAAPNTPPIGNANSTSVHMNQKSLLMHHRPPQPAAVRMQHEHDPGATAAPGQSNWKMDHPSIDKSVMISGCYSVPEKTQEVLDFPGFPSNSVGSQFEKHRMLMRRQQQLQQELGLSLINQVPAAAPNPAFNNVISASILMQHHDHEPKAIWNVDHPFINKELSYCSTISGCSRTSISGSLSSKISGSSSSTISDAVPKGIPEVMEAGLIGDIVASQLEAYQILQRVNQLGEQQLEQGSSLINTVPAAPNNPIGDFNNNVNSGSIHMPQKLSQYRQPVAPAMVSHMYRQHHDLQPPVAPMHHDNPQPIRIMDDVPFINEKGSMTSGRCSSMISSFNFEVEENRTCSWSTGGIDNHTGHGWGIESTLLPSNLGQFQDDIDELLLGFYD